MGFTSESVTRQLSGVLYWRYTASALSHVKKTSILTALYGKILRSATDPHLFSSRKMSAISWQSSSQFKKVTIGVSQVGIFNHHWQQVRQEHTQKEESTEEEKDEPGEKSHWIRVRKYSRNFLDEWGIYFLYIYNNSQPFKWLRWIREAKSINNRGVKMTDEEVIELMKKNDVQKVKKLIKEGIIIVCHKQENEVQKKFEKEVHELDKKHKE